MAHWPASKCRALHQITYLYDAGGRRIARAYDGTRTHAWSYGTGLLPLAEYDGSGALRTVFFYAGAGTPVKMIRSGQTYHIVSDRLGSPRLILDADGAVIKRLDYDAYGNILVDTNPAFDLPFGFAGGLRDAAHELIRFGARDYQPSTGRWTAKDPILFAGGWHLYAYVGNDPVNGTDGLGLGGSGNCPTLMSASATSTWLGDFDIFHANKILAEAQARAARAEQRQKLVEDMLIAVIPVYYGNLGVLTHHSFAVDPDNFEFQLVRHG